MTSERTWAAPADLRVPPSLFRDLPADVEGRLAMLVWIREAFEAEYLNADGGAARGIDAPGPATT